MTSHHYKFCFCPWKENTSSLIIWYQKNSTRPPWGAGVCQTNIQIFAYMYYFTAAAAAKSLQSCPTLCDSINGSPPSSPSLGFSRQEHWSGLPFPSPMHESEKWKWSLSVMSDSSRSHGLQPTRLLHPWDFPGKSTGVGCHCLLRLCRLGPLIWQK